MQLYGAGGYNPVVVQVIVVEVVLSIDVWMLGGSWDLVSKAISFKYLINWSYSEI